MLPTGANLKQIPASVRTAVKVSQTKNKPGPEVRNTRPSALPQSAALWCHSSRIHTIYDFLIAGSAQFRPVRGLLHVDGKKERKQPAGHSWQVLWGQNLQELNINYEMSTKHSQGGLIWCVHIFSLSVGMFHSASRQKNKVERGPSAVNVDKMFQGFGLFSPSLLCVSGVVASPYHQKHLRRAVVPSTIAALPPQELETIMWHFECRL